MKIYLKYFKLRSKFIYYISYTIHSNMINTKYIYIYSMEGVTI